MKDQLSPAAASKHERLQARGRAVAERLRAKSLHFDAEIVAQLLRSNSALRARASQTRKTRTSASHAPVKRAKASQ